MKKNSTRKIDRSQRLTYIFTVNSLINADAQKKKKKKIKKKQDSLKLT